MKKYLAILVLVSGIIAMFSSCYYEDIEFDKANLPDTISFSLNVVPIFEQGCNASVCHGGGKAPDLRPENAYQSLMDGGYVNSSDPVSSVIYQEVTTGGGMASYAKQGDDAMILQWIEQGAKNN
jgi:hypothetical protein